MGKSKETESTSYHVSRIGYIAKYILFLIILFGTIALIITNYPVPFISEFLPILYPIGIIIGLLGLTILEVGMRSTKIKLEEYNIIFNKGIFSKNTTRINYKSITDVNIRQSVLQRMFGYGNLEIGVPGAQQSITQHFSGTGDINLGDVRGHHAIVLQNFQKIRKLEKNILLRMRETHGQSKD
ncbi:MAG: PH domain-containing protein [Candidatus Aenigmatarchaeota archaeon]